MFNEWLLKFSRGKSHSWWLNRVTRNCANALGNRLAYIVAKPPNLPGSAVNADRLSGGEIQVAGESVKNYNKFNLKFFWIQLSIWWNEIKPTVSGHRFIVFLKTLKLLNLNCYRINVFVLCSCYSVRNKQCCAPGKSRSSENSASERI